MTARADRRRREESRREAEAHAVPAPIADLMAAVGAPPRARKAPSEPSRGPSAPPRLPPESSETLPAIIHELTDAERAERQRRGLDGLAALAAEEESRKVGQ